MVLSPDMQENDTMIELTEVGAVDTGGDDAVSSVYEIGYHLLPTLSEGEVQQAVSGLMEGLKKEGAVFVGDRFPAKTQLAYPIAKRVNSKRTRYDSAHFGWVAFELSKDAIANVKTMLDASPAVLRYLIVTTSKEAVAAALAGGATFHLATAPVTGSIEKPKRAAEGGGEMSETALDEALKDIAAEDTKAE